MPIDAAALSAQVSQSDPAPTTAPDPAQMLSQQATPGNTGQSIQAPSSADKFTNFNTAAMNHLMDMANVGSDQDIGDHVEMFKDNYRDQLAREFPKLSDDEQQKVVDHFAQGAKLNLQSELLKTLVNHEMDYLKSGTLPGRRATLQDVLTKIPGYGAEAGYAYNTKSAADNIAAGKGTNEDYQTIAQSMARAQYDAHSGLGQKLWDAASGLPTAAANFMMMPGGEALGLENVFARMAVGGATRSLNPFALASGALDESAPKIGLDENGKMQVTPGGNAAVGLAKRFGVDASMNAVFEGIDVLGPKTGSYPVRVAKGYGGVIAATQATQEAQYWSGLSNNPAFITGMMKAKTPEEREQVLKNFAAQAIAFGGAEAVGGLAKAPDPREAGILAYLKTTDVPVGEHDALVADFLKSKAPVPGTEPKAPPAAAQLPEEPPPTPAAEPTPEPEAPENTTPFITSPEAETAPPEPKPSEVPPLGQKTPWHDAYQAARASGLGHDAAMEKADSAHADGQSWVNTGTKFDTSGEQQSVQEEGGGRGTVFKGTKFMAPDGETHEIQMKVYEDGGVRVGVPDPEGDLAHVVLVNNKDGTHHGEMLVGIKPGLARALYDYATESGIKLVPSKSGEKGFGQTVDGKAFWQKNVERSVGIGKPKGEPPNELAKPPIPAAPKSPAEAAPQQRSAPLAAVRQKISQGQRVSPDEINAVFTNAGLTPQEIHAVEQKLAGRDLRDIKDDPIMGGVSHEQVRILQKRALGKLGWNKSTIAALMRGQEEADNLVRAVQNGFIVYPDQVEADPELVKDAVNAKQRFLDGLEQKANALLAEWTQDRDAGTLTKEKEVDYARRYSELTSRLNESYRPSEEEPEQLPEPGEPPPVRRESGGGVQAPSSVSETVAENAPTSPAASAPSSGPAPPVGPNPADTGPAPAPAGGGAAASGELVGGQWKGIPKSFRQEIADAGFDPGQVLSVAKEMQGNHNQGVGEHNAMLSEARRAMPKDIETNLRFGHYEDSDSVPGFDEVAATIERRYPYLTKEGENFSDTLFSLLREGNHEPIKLQDAIRQAVDYFHAVKNAAAETAAIEQAGRASGLNPQAVRAAISEASGEVADDKGVAGQTAPSGPAATDVGANANANAWNAALKAALDESGSANLDVLQQRARQLYERLTGMFEAVRDGLDKIAGMKFTATTRASREVGEAMGHVDASPGYVRMVIPRLIDKVFGENSTPEDRIHAGAVLNEMNLRQTRDAYMGKSQEGSVEAAKARQDSTDAGLRKIAARKAGDTVGTNIAARAQAEAQGRAKDGAKKATEALRIANDVETRIGKPDSPLKTEQDYQAALADPKLKAVLDAYKNEFVPIMEANFKKSQGMDELADIRDFTQHPDYPVNMMVKQSADEPTLDDPDLAGVGPSRGKLSNAQEKSLIFAKQRKGNAPNYEDDLGKIMENSLRRSDYLAKRAELDRMMVDKSLAEWGRRGMQLPIDGKPSEAFPYVKPPRGTQEAQQGQDHLYVRQDVAGEYRQLLGVDKPFRIPGVSDLARIPTWASLASSLEAVYHAKNLVTGFAKAGMNPVDLFTNGYKLLRNDPETVDRMIELAKIGSLKDGASFEAGHILPEAWKKADPTYYMGRALDFLDKATRLSANDAFDRLVKNEGVFGKLRKTLGVDVQDTETNRRDFINQIAGNYSKRSQSQLVAFLRDSGISPFSTAGMKYYLDGLKSFIGSTGLKSNTWKSDLLLRSETGLKMVAGLAAIGIANYLMWGRADGDDATPLGSIKLGNTADGKTMHFALANILSGLPRGARETGLLATGEGVRRGQSMPMIADKAADDFWTSLVHPVFGPMGQTVYTAATGKNTLGQKVAAQPEPGGSQAFENIKAALGGMNPVVANVTGLNRPASAQSATMMEHVLEGLGPFAPKTASNKVVSDFYDELQRAQASHQRFTQNKQRGLKTPGYALPQLQQYRRMLHGEQRLTVLNRAMRAAKTDEEKTKIRQLQVQAATRALGR